MLIPIGGGGLSSGVAVAVRALRPAARILGVEPEVAADARDSTARSVQSFVDQVLRPPAWSLRITLNLGRFIVGLFRHWPRDPNLTGVTAR